MKHLGLIITIALQGFVFTASSNPDSLLIKANNLYVNSNFDGAAQIYQQLIDSGYHNADIYYNLGNSYFKLNRISHAILNYERAYLLNPKDEDIEFNLEFARTFTVDRIEPLPVFFAISWYRSVRSILTANGWAVVSLFFLAATLSLLLVFWFAYGPKIKRISFFIAILSFILMVSSLVFSKQEKDRITKRNYAIVFQSVVAVKSSPGDTGKDIFILHAGTKVRVTKALGEWVEVKIADGNKGWLQSIAVELI